MNDHVRVGAAGARDEAATSFQTGGAEVPARVLDYRCAIEQHALRLIMRGQDRGEDLTDTSAGPAMFDRSRSPSGVSA